MCIARAKRVYFKISSIDERRCSKVPQMSYGMVSALNHDNCILTFHMTSEALLSICAHQYLKFWSKLFWPLLYTSNTMCPVHCMMVLAPISLSNGWCKSKICIHYHCVNIRINFLGCNANPFDPWSRHIGLPSDPMIGDFNGWNFCYAWINMCTMIHQKSGHNTWCRHHIEIVISNSESTSKTGPGYI